MIKPSTWHFCFSPLTTCCMSPCRSVSFASLCATLQVFLSMASYRSWRWSRWSRINESSYRTFLQAFYCIDGITRYSVLLRKACIDVGAISIYVYERRFQRKKILNLELKVCDWTLSKIWRGRAMENKSTKKTLRELEGCWRYTGRWFLELDELPFLLSIEIILNI